MGANLLLRCSTQAVVEGNMLLAVLKATTCDPTQLSRLAHNLAAPVCIVSKSCWS